jgi:hypothetical protein
VHGIYARKKISVPRNLLLNSEEIGPKKQWQTQKLPFLESFSGGRAKRDKLNSFLPSGLGKGVWGGRVSNTLVQDYASGRRHLPLRTFTEYTPWPSTSIDVQWR